MLWCGWSIPQVGHLCGAVVVLGCGDGVGPRVGQSCFCLSAIRPPHPLSSYSPANKTPWRPLSGAALRHPTIQPDPPNPSAVIPSLVGQSCPCWLVATKPCCFAASLARVAVLPADLPSLAAVLPASRFAAPLVQPGGPRPLRRCDSGGPKEPLPRVAASSNGQPLFKGCMNTLIGGIAYFT